jgi:hypothetical protein
LFLYKKSLLFAASFGSNTPDKSVVVSTAAVLGILIQPPPPVTAPGYIKCIPPGRIKYAGNARAMFLHGNFM